MSMTTALKNIVDEKLKCLYVAFIAEVLSVNGRKAKIQPLGLIRDYGGEAQKQTILTNVPIAQAARYKLTESEIECVSNVNFGSETASTRTEKVAKLTPIKKGDLVFCVCCDRNISAALRGENALPPVGWHKKSDCVIVSII